MTLELDNFVNDGFGWECKRCRTTPDPSAHPRYPRFYVEGEAEEKESPLAVPSRARWRDAAQQVLYCPVCLVEEVVNKA